MWFDYKKDVAPLYKDETYRRMFATASGRRRPKNVDKLKTLKTAGEEDDRTWRARLAARWARWTRGSD